MAAITVRLRRHETVAAGTMAFHFDKPADFHFKAGQTIDVTLPNPPETDAEGNIRTFSLVCAPSDPDLAIATRMRNTAFKRVLGALPPGSPVEIEGPGGSFTLHKNASKPAVFLAGGIGVTPFHSIIRQAMADRLPHALYLFLSNHRPQDAPFLAEFTELAARHTTFHFVPTMTDLAGSSDPWTGATGLIDKTLLTRELADLHGPIYYLAGPPGFVTAMREMLSGAGVDEDDIRSEEFSGY